jgi:hypothetical protein
MNNIMKTAIAILGVLLIICLAVLYSLSSQRKELLEELDGLRKTRAEATLQISDTSNAIEEANQRTASIRNSAKGEKLQKEIDQLEAQKELLEQIRIEKETAAAFEKAGLGHGMMGYEVGENPAADHRQKMQEQQEGLDTRFRQFGEFVQNCDLTALPEQERKTLTEYMDLRKKWNDIIYDPQVAVEEKIETYKASQALDNSVRAILEKLFNSQHSEEYAAFKEMHDKLWRIFQNDARTKIWANIHITNEKGEKEEVIHQY